MPENSEQQPIPSDADPRGDAAAEPAVEETPVESNDPIPSEANVPDEMTESGETVTETEDVEISEEQETEDASEEAETADEAVTDEVEEDSDEMEPVEALGREETVQAVHALLFASDRPLNAERIAEALGDIDRDVVVTLVEELRSFIDTLPVPYVLREIAGGYQLVTKPGFGAFIRRLYAIKKSNRLSKSVLETLAIIAYKQPVTRPTVEAIRGVSVSHAFDILQEKRLIKVAGVAELPGRPKLYRTTDEFLMHFGLESLKELPSVEEIREMGY